MPEQLQMGSQNHYTEDYKGLQAKDIPALQQQYGSNLLPSDAGHGFLRLLKSLIREPMLILLLIACIIYFSLGQLSEALMMVVAITLVVTIALYQENKSARALEALKNYTVPKVNAIRDGQTIFIDAAELVPGDMMLLNEGEKIPADAIVLKQNDLSVNESLITGESFPVNKTEAADNNVLYQGATINGGRCVAQVTATGVHTVLGNLGRSLSGGFTSKTLLQNQVVKAVNRLAIFGITVLLLILLLNYIRSHDIIKSILLGLTIAMAAIPEEIPVAFSSFMALGALEMSKLGIISRNPQVIENLGRVSVLCMDKTGTITENKMTVATVFDFSANTVLHGDEVCKAEGELMRFAVMASEHEPFDALEKAIWNCYYGKHGINRPLLPDIMHEYQLSGNPPMMTHVYKIGNEIIAACKGAPERIISVCNLTPEETKNVNEQLNRFTTGGYKVIGVAGVAHNSLVFPEKQEDFQWQFKGLLALYDPPRQEAATFIKDMYALHIRLLLVTGDHPETSLTVAGNVGMQQLQHYKTGAEIMAMTDEQILAVTKQTSLFVRMFPEAKLKMVNALKNTGDVVAMIGDGVNDGGALKKADVGIAMGEKGTDVARLAADLVLTQDRLDKITDAVKYGRKIISNLKKAIRYIVTIHIPILLIASIPLLLGWRYQAIFSPIHIIFLELIMGPTCSIFFEREPIENDIVYIRPVSAGLFSRKELLMAMLQGLFISAGILAIYYFKELNHSVIITRTMVFISLLICNLLLTFTNRSFTESIVKTIRYKNNLTPYIVLSSVAFILFIYLMPQVRHIFEISLISWDEVLLCLVVSIITVGWFEVYKLIKGTTQNKSRTV